MPPRDSRYLRHDGFKADSQYTLAAKGQSPKLLNRFYEAVVFLESVTKCAITLVPPRPPEATCGELLDHQESAFHRFVDKIGQICDWEPYRNTITAVVILQHEDHVEYRFASNARREPALAKTKMFLTSVLMTVGTASTDELRSEAFLWQILNMVLLACRKKVVKIAHHLGKRIPECLSMCGSNPTGKFLSTNLETILKSLRLVDGLDEEYLTACHELMHLIQETLRDFKDTIQAFTYPGQLGPRECWYEMRHAMGRLFSYHRAVKHILWARSRWPELFEDFVVTHVSSSREGKNPLTKLSGKKSDRKSNTRVGVGLRAYDIIGRMTSEQSRQSVAREQAQQLQAIDLDTIITENSQSLGPIVHCECLLYQSLVEEEGAVHHARFFNGWKYIGCSKPTCKLCKLYFDALPDGVTVQSSHGNLYTNWRMPEVFTDAGVEEQKHIMNKMLALIRAEAFCVLRDKVTRWKRFDSSTDATFPDFVMLTQGHIDEASELPQDFERLEISDSSSPDPSVENPESSEASTSPLSITSQQEEEKEEQDSDSDGGASLDEL